jgi:hypothetical protein
MISLIYFVVLQIIGDTFGGSLKKCIIWVTLNYNLYKIRCNPENSQSTPGAKIGNLPGQNL